MSSFEYRINLADALCEATIDQLMLDKNMAKGDHPKDYKECISGVYQEMQELEYELNQEIHNHKRIKEEIGDVSSWLAFLLKFYT